LIRAVPASVADNKWRILCGAARHVVRWIAQRAVRFTRDGTHYEAHVSGNLSSGDGSVLRAWALSGEGTSWEAHWDIAHDPAAGRLVELLPGYRCATIELYAIFAPGKPVPPRIRLFVGHVVDAMSGAGK
jgi:DNA-binding transcriptional LysR family regulator